jgi:N-acetyl-alpha-D-glucosaminyl L-malate synthase BshA
VVGRLRIGLLCHATPGGSSRAALELARALRRRGHEVVLLCTGRPFGLVPDEGIPVVTLPGAAGDRHPTELPVAWTAAEMRALVEALAAAAVRLGLDVLHLHYALPFAACAVALRSRLDVQAPAIVVTLHGTDVVRPFQGPDERRRLRGNLLALDAVTAVSADLAGRAVRELGLCPKPRVLPNLVDLGRFRPRHDAARSLRVVHVSSFRPVKRPLLLARAFAALRRRTGAELWLVGDGPGAGAVRAVLEGACVGDGVRWWGLRADIAPILAGADLALLTSAYESFSLFALEAMASGLPVVAFAVGGLPELVPDGRAGHLVPDGDLDGLVDAAVDLLRDPIRRRAMGAAGSARAVAFGADRVVGQYEELYREVLAMPAPAIRHAS